MCVCVHASMHTRTLSYLHYPHVFMYIRKKLPAAYSKFKCYTHKHKICVCSLSTTPDFNAHSRMQAIWMTKHKRDPDPSSVNHSYLRPLHLPTMDSFTLDINLLPGDPLAPPLHHNKSDPVPQFSKPTIETEYSPGLSCREF